MTNEFPEVWFETFLSRENAAPVERELSFIQVHFPLPDFTRLLDVPCGIGRHAGPLNELGYEVLGIDRSQRAVTMAREQYPNVEFRVGDMFDLGSLEDEFDGLLCLWQSFGYGTSGQNLDLLADMRGVVRPGGRILMDIYNADAAAKLPEQAQEERADRTVWTRRSWSGSRLRVELQYSGSEVRDVHEWELYSPDTFSVMADTVGLDTVTSCAWFDPRISPSAEHLRMQFLLERPS